MNVIEVVQQMSDLPYLRSFLYRPGSCTLYFLAFAEKKICEPKSNAAHALRQRMQRREKARR